jgi:hypothetical protein
MGWYESSLVPVCRANLTQILETEKEEPLSQMGCLRKQLSPRHMERPRTMFPGGPGNQE